MCFSLISFPLTLSLITCEISPPNSPFLKVDASVSKKFSGMSSLDNRNYEERQISQPIRLATDVASGTDSSVGNNLSKNGTKLFEVFPSSDPVLAGDSSEQLPFSNNQNPIDGGVIESEGTCRSFSLDEIRIATNNFDDALVVGIGGFGKVYKGFIDDSATMAAIKRLNSESKQGAGEFWMEVKMLSKLRHANLVALIGYCNECQEMILVYEYMAFGTLASHLYRLKTTESNTSFSPLSWEERLEMYIGAARGLDHLHSGTTQSFIHRDVKSTNILIDENWVAKISDFGLSKGPTSHSITHITTEVKGTFGYLDPDYFRTHRLTAKSDVYAFGVVLLEVLCGRQPVDSKLDSEQIGLIYWAQQCFKNGKFAEVIDPSLSGQIAQPCLKSFVVLAKNCLSESPRSRPTMAEVLGRLELTLLSQQRGRTEGIMTNGFQSMMDWWWRERKDNSSSSGQSNDSPQKSDLKTGIQFYREFSLADILVATKDFSKSFLVRNSDKVYKGSVNIDGKVLVVVIIRFKKLEGVGDEIHPNRMLLHPNILSPIGFCTEGDELILVYDYMANGSLQDYLLHNDTPLSWEMRLQICIGAAQGLKYLLANGELELIHRGIEPSSILLDENWVAKVMLSKIRTITNTSTGLLRSTTMHYNSRYQGDVLYSFGVMLLEVLICNKLLGRLFYERKQLDDIILSVNIHRVMDPHLVGKIGPECLGEFVKITWRCLFEQGMRRPSIDFVVRSLQLAVHSQEKWQSLNTSTADRTQSSSSNEDISAIICRKAVKAPNFVPASEWTEGPLGPIFML